MTTQSKDSKTPLLDKLGYFARSVFSTKDIENNIISAKKRGDQTKINSEVQRHKEFLNDARLAGETVMEKTISMINASASGISTPDFVSRDTVNKRLTVTNRERFSWGNLWVIDQGPEYKAAFFDSMQKTMDDKLNFEQCLSVSVKIKPPEWDDSSSDPKACIEVTTTIDLNDHEFFKPTMLRMEVVPCSEDH